MKVEIWSDFACPFCYIGKKKFENALAKFDKKDEVEVIFRAYQLNKDAPKKMIGDPYEVFALSHNMSVKQAKERFNQVTEIASTVGLKFDYSIMKMTNTFDAHRLAKWANTVNKENELSERLMKAYFVEGKDLADYDVLIPLAAEVGLDKDKARDILNNNSYSDDVKYQQSEASQLGISSVPFFVIDQKYGISGAQSEEYFLGALKQIYQETLAEESLKEDEKASCNDDSCSI